MKKYITPTISVYEVETTSIMQVSGNSTSMGNNTNYTSPDYLAGEGECDAASYRSSLWN